MKFISRITFKQFFIDICHLYRIDLFFFMELIKNIYLQIFKIILNIKTKNLNYSKKIKNI